MLPPPVGNWRTVCASAVLNAASDATVNSAAARLGVVVANLTGGMAPVVRFSGPRLSPDAKDRLLVW